MFSTSVFACPEEVSVTKEEIRELKIRLEIVEELVKKYENYNNHSLIKSQPGQKLSVENDKADYDLALAALKEQDFHSAEKRFANFIVDFPDSSLQSNAHFWYGETFYHRGLFDRAFSIYLKGYKKFPTGPKAADSLLKASFCLSSLNKKADACNMLNRIAKEFKNKGKAFDNKVMSAKIRFMCNKIPKVEGSD